MTHDLNKLPFLYLVWFLENGDDHYRICAAVMCMNDGLAVVNTIRNDGSGAGMCLPIEQLPIEPHYIG